MSNIFRCFLMVLTAAHLQASYCQQLLSQLAAVNTQWLHQPEREKIILSFSEKPPSEYNEWIRLHLQLVEKTLRNRATHHLTETQKTNRQQALNHLKAYWQAGIFPVNDFLPYTTPVFIDRKGTFCAVGYLMKQTGAEQLARTIDRSEKFAYVYQIRTQGVNEWATKHGFTLDELAWIQPAYQVHHPSFEMEGGLNGTVNCIVKGNQTHLLFAGGSFTHTGKGIACNGIAAWVSGFAGYDWINVGEGVNGEIHAMVYQDGKLYVGGKFSTAGKVAARNVAVYDESSGIWQSLGSLDSTVFALTVYKNELYAGGIFSGLVAKWNGTSWQNLSQNIIQGESVRTLKVIDTLLYVGGNFEWTTGVPRKNIAVFDGKKFLLSGVGTPTPVNDLEWHNGKIYAACDVIYGSDSSALCVWDNGEWKTVLKPVMGLLDFFEGRRIKQIKTAGDKLLACGDFSCGSGMLYGANLMAISKLTLSGDSNTYTVCEPLASTDKPVHSVLPDGHKIYFGGEFITNRYTDTLHHIGYLHMNVSDLEKAEKSADNILVSPNPVTSHLNIFLPQGNAEKSIDITDISGKTLLSKSLKESMPVLDVAHLPAGVYVLRAHLRGRSYATRFVKW